jgi:hypothetical protein
MRCDDSLEHVVEEARESIEEQASSPDALAKTNRALFAIKSKGKPWVGNRFGIL